MSLSQKRKNLILDLKFIEDTSKETSGKYGVSSSLDSDEEKRCRKYIKDIVNNEIQSIRGNLPQAEYPEINRLLSSVTFAFTKKKKKLSRRRRRSNKRN